ncbi:unnamed protein product [Ilex paraguariensis]|uniref:Uncharacterized protein n=1 Tax=Ilex paraguariensis TaxID=185542 RepID=A0ABC8TI30_9AQUA
MENSALYSTIPKLTNLPQKTQQNHWNSSVISGEMKAQYQLTNAATQSSTFWPSKGMWLPWETYFGVRADHLLDEILLIKNASGNTALHEAARSGQKVVAEIMVTKKPDLVFQRNDMNETPLYLAAAFGKSEVFTLLESYNSDCRIRRQFFMLPLRENVTVSFQFHSLVNIHSNAGQTNHKF